jgi:hypothetical protein
MVKNNQINLGIKIIVPLILAAILVTGGVVLVTRSVPRQVACTQEAKQCPDGSYVGRSGPSCQFAACPSPSPTPTPSPLDCNGPDSGCPSGYTCIQKCGPPVVRVDDPPPGYYCELNAVAAKPRMCPICLASNTRIATPDGEINIKDIKSGMIIWSIDAGGEKVQSTVLAVSHTAVPITHQVVDLVLADGREVWVSPNHPSADGRLVGSLRAGDAFDGALVRSANLIPYWDNETYDLLPDSTTHAYWTNDVLLKSTLISPP